MLPTLPIESVTGSVVLRFGAFVRRASVTSVICFLAEFGSTDAGALTGTELYRACRQKALSAGGISCIAYVRGFVDGITLGHGLGKTSPTVYCLSAAGLDADQARLIIQKYLRDHPESLHLEAGNLAANALTEAFPCPSKSN